MTAPESILSMFLQTNAMKKLIWSHFSEQCIYEALINLFIHLVDTSITGNGPLLLLPKMENTEDAVVVSLSRLSRDHGTFCGILLKNLVLGIIRLSRQGNNNKL